MKFFYLKRNVLSVWKQTESGIRLKPGWRTLQKMVQLITDCSVCTRTNWPSRERLRLESSRGRGEEILLSQITLEDSDLPCVDVSFLGMVPSLTRGGI
jgi:hypothetical protein